tara:strand:- start:403 stop:648 length:246 start_codon:yes stop_codon:yes gene_type:complete
MKKELPIINAEFYEFVVLYFQSRNVHRWEWVPYKCFKVLISYLTGIRDIDTLRSIFEKLMQMGYFEKRKIASKTEYLFIFD